MTVAQFLDENAALPDPMPSLFVPADAEPGFLEYTARCAIRDLVALHGFEEARLLVAGFINDLAESKAERRRAA
jgi:hypothetical protein